MTFESSQLLFQGFNFKLQIFDIGKKHQLISFVISFLVFTSCQASWDPSDAAAAPPLLTAAVKAAHDAEERLPGEEEGLQGRPGREGPEPQLQQGPGLLPQHSPALLPGLLQVCAPAALAVRGAAPPPRRRRPGEGKLPRMHRPSDDPGVTSEEEEEQMKRETPRWHHDGCCGSSAAAPRTPPLYTRIRASPGPPLGPCPPFVETLLLPSDPRSFL